MRYVPLQSLEKEGSGQRQKPLYIFPHIIDSSSKGRLFWYGQGRWLEVREALVEKNRLSDDTREGEHGKTAVLDLLELDPVDLRLGLAFEVVSAEAEVSWCPAGTLEHGGDAQPRHYLSDTDPDQHVAHGAERHKRIVGGAGSEALPLRGEEGNADAQIDGDESQPGQHADTAVLDLSLPKVVHGEVVRDTEGVEAYITNVSLSVLRSWEEGESGALLGIEGRYRLA